MSLLHYFNPQNGHYLYSVDSILNSDHYATDYDLPLIKNNQIAVFKNGEWEIEEASISTVITMNIVVDKKVEKKRNLLLTREKIYTSHDLDALMGKTANALVATLNLQMQIYQRLATAQSLADVRAAVAPALPLMQRVQEMIAKGELLSVQTVQGMSDEEAVIEALEAMTKAARVIRDHATATRSEANDTNEN